MFKKIPLKPCPVCGDKRRTLIRTLVPKALKHISVACAYCGHESESCMTEWGARRAWNRGTNIVYVKDRKEMTE